MRRPATYVDRLREVASRLGPEALAARRPPAGTGLRASGGAPDVGYTRAPRRAPDGGPLPDSQHDLAELARLRPRPDIRLIATDMDGTLVDDAKQIHDELLAPRRRAARAGHHLLPGERPPVLQPAAAVRGRGRRAGLRRRERHLRGRPRPGGLLGLPGARRRAAGGPPGAGDSRGGGHRLRQALRLRRAARPSLRRPGGPLLRAAEARRRPAGDPRTTTSSRSRSTTSPRPSATPRPGWPTSAAPTRSWCPGPTGWTC